MATVILIIAFGLMINFLSLSLTKNFWKSVFLTFFLSNILGVLLELFLHGQISGWWPVAYLYFNLGILLGWFLGFVLWDYIVKKKEDQNR